jgi:starch phosphorylase
LTEASIAYFSMEVGLSEEMPTYSGGLGVLAGDTLRAAADAGLPMVAVTLLYRKGYFHQRLDEEGRQTEEPDSWNVSDYLREMEPRVVVELEGKTVTLRCWLRELQGVLGVKIPVYFLDSHLEENDEAFRDLTDSLYGGDRRYRLCQEVILGVGGVRMLQALGYRSIETHHMNEGHSSLLTLELMGQAARRAGRKRPSDEDIAQVRDHCVFTTHTPVAAGHDRFPKDLVDAVLGTEIRSHLEQVYPGDEVNMTELALRHSRYVNGVARRHGDVTRNMFDGYVVEAITNGVHAATWAAPSFQDLFDRRVPGWREDNQSLRYLSYVPIEQIAEAHREAKQALLAHVLENTGIRLEEEAFTIGFARRATAYKRANLLFTDLARLNRMSEDLGPIQIVFAGKAHPRDDKGKGIIEEIFAAKKGLGVRLVYLENYDMKLGRLLTSGCDLWLNTPEPPKEASGTSGMKAALNGVPSLSILDGWWIEGHLEGVTGWSIGDLPPALSGESDGERDADNLYEKLETAVLPLYYGNREGYLHVMRHAVALNGSFFNTERMIGEYTRRAYLHAWRVS